MAKRNFGKDYKTPRELVTLLERRGLIINDRQKGRTCIVPWIALSTELCRYAQIDKETAARLRKLHLVEGRYPKLFLSEYVAKTTNNDELKTEYIKNRSFNDKHFREMIISYLRSFGGATRSELNTLLQSKLSDVLTDEQKKRKIGNMLFSLKRKGMIELLEGKKWVLVEI